MEVAQTTLEKITLLKPDFELNINKSLEAIAYLKENRINEEYLAQFEGSYRDATNELVLENRIIANNIYIKATNQEGYFIFPAGASTLKRGVLGKGFNHKLLFNKQGKAYAIKRIESWKEKEYSFIDWKQDSVIWKAEALLKAGNYEKAQIAYQRALEKNPDHFYLYQHQQYLAYLQSKSEEAVQQNFQKLAGQYGAVKIWIEDGLLYYKRPGLVRRIFWPISDKRFTTLLFYSFNYEFVEKNGKVVGIQGYGYYDETKEWEKDEDWYFERTELLD